MFLLASCSGFSLTGDKGEPVRSLSLMDGSVTVAAPSGYCIDERTSRTARGFVVMAGCALVSNEQRMPAIDGLITVQVGDPDTAFVAADEDALEALLTTAQGAAILSATGDPTVIEIDRLESRDGVVYVHFLDSAPPPADGLEQLEWRAFFDIGTRLATVTIRGFARAPIDTEEGLSLLRRAVATIRDASGA